MGSLRVELQLQHGGFKVNNSDEEEHYVDDEVVWISVDLCLQMYRRVMSIFTKMRMMNHDSEESHIF